MSDPSVSHQSEDEGVLIARAQGGDLAAFDQLVLQHQQTVFAVSLRMLGDREEAKDVAQDVFVHAYRGLGAFKGEAKLSTWLISITMNVCRNQRRWWARQRRFLAGSVDATLQTEEGAVEFEVADPAPGPAHAAQHQELSAQIQEALGQLDEPHRSVVILRDLQGCSYEEIAAIVGCQVGTVKSRLSRARLQLRALLERTVE